MQVAVGYLLYYGRSVDSRILPATCALASEQAAPTLDTMRRLDRLLGYVAAHPNGRKIYRVSDMILRALADASYLSRPKAGSVAGSFHFLGMHEPTPVFINHPVFAHSDRIPVVCSFSGEAEYGGAYAAARIATEERRILANLECPQPPTQLYCDNECAISLASDTIAPQMSKSIDMRFHWLRDRVWQGASVHHQIRSRPAEHRGLLHEGAACCPTQAPRTLRGPR